MIDPRGNPNVNSPVISDFSSNADHAPYASTTEDLLDRIRFGVEAIVAVAAVSYTHLTLPTSDLV